MSDGLHRHDVDRHLGVFPGDWHRSPLNFSGVVPDDVHITQEWLIMRGHLEIVKRRPFSENLHPNLRVYGLLAVLAKGLEQEHSTAFQQRVLNIVESMGTLFAVRATQLQRMRHATSVYSTVKSTTRQLSALDERKIESPPARSTSGGGLNNIAGSRLFGSA
jgi:hypothetical protein